MNKAKLTHPEQARCRKELEDLIAQGARPKYLFFWGHTPKVNGRIDQSCLSNWFPAPFFIDSARYPTTEHYMMAEKARLFDDAECFAKIIVASSPAAAKRLGREVRNFDEMKWIEHRFEIVVAGNFEKFRQNDNLGDFLIQTGTKVLVEASPRDRIWGIGMGKDNPKAANPKKWNGMNLLGFALMEARARILFEKVA
ncbi:MAG: NADAR family protein [Desulfobacteraceae bacterium]|jgi:ribA/ribD-fused uncharacterized protein